MMMHRGLAKLSEELGELQQVIGKLLQYPTLQDTTYEKHPDGSTLRSRIEIEIADVRAAIDFVIKKLSLDSDYIELRRRDKLVLYNTWDILDPEPNRVSSSEGPGSKGDR